MFINRELSEGKKTIQHSSGAITTEHGTFIDGRLSEGKQTFQDGSISKIRQGTSSNSRIRQGTFVDGRLSEGKQTYHVSSYGRAALLSRALLSMVGFQRAQKGSSLVAAMAALLRARSSMVR